MAKKANGHRDRQLFQLKEGKRETDKKYRELLKELDRVEKERDAVRVLEVGSYRINTSSSKGMSATAVVLASDWHYEELVESDTVSGLNRFNLRVADSRIQKFFVGVAKLVKVKQNWIRVEDLVLALLGDFISGHIHEELMENCQLPPIRALIAVQDRIAGGIRYLLQNTDANIIIPCHSGNHGRTTKKIRFATERGNSFEYYMYHQLANHFMGEPRVRFVISQGYHSYLRIGKDFVIRFHHGHAIRYQGGVGGIFIPARKALQQWDKGVACDLDCFGHFHQSKYDTGNFMCNGSLIGYNAYALSIKADYEVPSQSFFLVNHQRKQVTDYSPIWLD